MADQENPVEKANTDPDATGSLYRNVSDEKHFITVTVRVLAAAYAVALVVLALAATLRH